MGRIPHELSAVFQGGRLETAGSMVRSVWTLRSHSLVGAKDEARRALAARLRSHGGTLHSATLHEPWYDRERDHKLGAEGDFPVSHQNDIPLVWRGPFKIPRNA